MGSLVGDTLGVVTCVLGQKIVPDMAADRSSSCNMFVEMANIATKPSSRDDGLVAILVISTDRGSSDSLKQGGRRSNSMMLVC